MIRIAVDAMGGDFAPESAVKGVNLAIAAFDNIQEKECLHGISSASSQGRPS